MSVEGWIEKRLGQVAEITMGQSPDSKYYSEEEIGMPFLQGCAEFAARFPAARLFCSQRKKIGKTDSILFSVRAPVGKTNIADRDYIIGRGLAAINGKEVIQDYLEQFLKISEEQFRNASQGSTFEAINSAELANWSITFPVSTAEQTQIAAILSTIDRAIEQTEAIIAKQQRIKTGLMQDLLTRGIDEQGNIRSEATHEFKDSPLGRIPVEWDAEEIEKLLVTIIDYRGKTPLKSNSGIPLITAKIVRFGYLEEPDEFIPEDEYERRMTRGYPSKGDVLFTTEAPLGNVAQVKDERVALGQRLLTLKSGPRLNTNFLFYVLMDEGIRRQFDALSSGSTVTGIKQSQFRKVFIYVPRMLHEQEKIASILRSIDSEIRATKTELEKLICLKTGLMQDLLIGKVRVTGLLEKAQGEPT